METKRDLFDPLFIDLLHLEVNLIRSPIVLRPVPSPRVQVSEIITTLDAKANDLSEPSTPGGNNMIVAQAAAAVTDGGAPGEVLRNEPFDFRDALRHIEGKAKERLEAIDQDERQDSNLQPHLQMHAAGTSSVDSGVAEPDVIVDTEKQILLRVQNDSQNLLRILSEANYQPQPPRQNNRTNETPPDAHRTEIAAQSIAASTAEPKDNATGDDFSWDPSPEHFMQIRKMWEVKPEEKVLMRTVISMDGDVITYVDPDHSGETFSYLHQLHGNSVQISISFWMELARILLDFVNNVVGAALRGGKSKP